MAVRLNGSSPSQQFSVDINHVGDEIVLTLHGELDEWTRPQFVDALEEIEQTQAPAILDLSDLSFIDARNIGVIHRACQLASTRGTHIALVSAGEHLAKVLEMTGLGSAITTYDELHRDSDSSPTPSDASILASRSLPAPAAFTAAPGLAP